MSRQQKLLPRLMPLAEGLRQSWEWYRCHEEGVGKRAYMAYIDEKMRNEAE